MITVKELPLKEFIECCKDMLVKFMKEPAIEPNASLGKIEYKEYVVLTAFSKESKTLYRCRRESLGSGQSFSFREVRLLLEIEGIHIVEGFWSEVELISIFESMESESIESRGW